MTYTDKEKAELQAEANRTRAQRRSEDRQALGVVGPEENLELIDLRPTRIRLELHPRELFYNDNSRICERPGSYEFEASILDFVKALGPAGDTSDIDSDFESDVVFPIKTALNELYNNIIGHGILGYEGKEALAYKLGKADKEDVKKRLEDAVSQQAERMGTPYLYLELIPNEDNPNLVGEVVVTSWDGSPEFGHNVFPGILEKELANFGLAGLEEDYGRGFLTLAGYGFESSVDEVSGAISWKLKIDAEFSMRFPTSMNADSSSSEAAA